MTSSTQSVSSQSVSSPSIVLDETITVPRPPQEVFAYLADFARIEEWDPGVARARRLSDGTPTVGSRFEVELTLGTSLLYTLIEAEPHTRLKFQVQSKPFQSQEALTFTPVDEGTRIRYVATFDFAQPYLLLARTFPRVLDQVGKAAMQGLKAALEDRFPAPDPPGRSTFSDSLVLPALYRFTSYGFERARRNWRPASASMQGKHVLLTGATSGLGLAAALELAQRGASLTLVARNPDKAALTLEQLKRRSGNSDIRFLQAELSERTSIDALADQLLAEGRPLDVLIHNAGALLNQREVASDGLEKSFALLLYAPWRLTERLQPLLEQAARPGRPARVVNVLSGGLYTQPLLLEDLQSGLEPYSGPVAYARAKRGLLMLTERWAEQGDPQRVVYHAMHPGWADTPGVESSLPGFYRLTRPVLRTPQQGADTIVWLACASEVGRCSGLFWLDRMPQPAHLLASTRQAPDLPQRLHEALLTLAPQG